MTALPIRITWNGEKNRPLHVMRICDCGTCTGFAKQVAPGSTGFLTWSDEQGQGGSVFVDENTFQRLDGLLKDDPFTTLAECLELLKIS